MEVTEICEVIAISIHALLAESDMLHDLCKTEEYEFLSTLSLRRATAVAEAHTRASVISIHALLAESDKMLKDFSTSALVFLSTLSLRRATV